ncbi:hypothetical protein GK091_25645 [Spirosoma agri]|uniref:Uncharacterized protein n=1 Tax=Spirosoma agri TaxID=1987381 RepID=A0A6M0IRZ3_9BACT|nr:hypothetical protein [Spirosoma agri]NEU70285.1 hypothetical protein [Spirosoma agri]
MAACDSGSRLSAEMAESLRVSVLGNPVAGKTLAINIREVASGFLRLETLGERDYPIDELGVWQLHCPLL